MFMTSSAPAVVRKALPLFCVASVALGLSVGTELNRRGRPDPAPEVVATVRLVGVHLDAPGIDTGDAADVQRKNVAAVADYQIGIHNRGEGAVLVAQVRDGRSRGTRSANGVVATPERQVDPGRLALMSISVPLQCPSPESADPAAWRLQLLRPSQAAAPETETAGGQWISPVPIGAGMELGACSIADSTLPPGWDHPLIGSVVPSAADRLQIEVEGLAPHAGLLNLRVAFTGSPVAVTVISHDDATALLELTFEHSACPDPNAAAVSLPVGLSLVEVHTLEQSVTRYVVVGGALARWLTAQLHANCPQTLG